MTPHQLATLKVIEAQIVAYLESQSRSPQPLDPGAAGLAKPVPRTGAPLQVAGGTGEACSPDEIAKAVAIYLGQLRPSVALVVMCEVCAELIKVALQPGVTHDAFNDLLEKFLRMPNRMVFVNDPLEELQKLVGREFRQ